jgi:hypothetical protein
MGNLLFWLGIGAAQKGAGPKPMEPRHWVASLIVGTLVALLIAVECFFCWSATNNEAALEARRWPQRTNLWRDRTNPRRASERLRGRSVHLEEQCAQHLKVSSRLKRQSSS